RKVVEYIERTLDPEVLTDLDEALREEIVDQLDTKRLAAAVAELDTDDAVEIIEELDQEVRQEILEEVDAQERALIEESLSYPDDSAGRLMQREVVALPQAWTVGRTIDFMRESEDLPDDFYDLFVVDNAGVPVGIVPLNVLLRARRPVRIHQIMNPEITVIPVTTDQEEVAQAFRDRDLVSAPVVDASGALVGMITIDDIVDVIDEEAEEDMLRLAKVGDAGLFEPVLATARNRIQWLVIALINAI
ncbi:MAG: magnesium transporter, partial [bacterium]|nr:magnesium transporter [bacterium]